MSSNVKSSAGTGCGAALVPNRRFPEFQEADGWETAPGDKLFRQVNNREAPPGLPILAITQEHGAIPRDMIDYHVSVTEKSLETYKEVRPGDFIISLRSFQGGIEFSEYHGICSPAYVILRKRGDLSDRFYKQHFKSHDFIRQLTKNLEGLRDGKMISYKQFSELHLLKPSLSEQQKIAECLASADALIDAQGRKVEALRDHKKGLMQQLFPQEGETRPRLRFPEFRDEWAERKFQDLSKSISSGKDKAVPDGDFYLYGSTGIIGKTRNASYTGAYILVARVGANCGLLTKASGKFGVTDNALVIVLKSHQHIDFVLYQLGHIGLNKMNFGSGQPLITGRQLKELRILAPKEEEQQRIADCLTSLDDFIAAETRKLDTLKTHKKGLMQQLFPQVGEADA
jgi:type I restriction enzyme S subunit